MRIALLILVGALVSTTTLAQQTAAPCSEVEAYKDLDFWVGSWRVVDEDGKHLGDNVIEKVLDGCAVMEHWTSSDGSQGKSWFYYLGYKRTWKQVWVTERATTPWGTKEKELIERLKSGALRFQGTLYLGEGQTILDRTTLSPLDDGRVRQTIETSRDDGKTWTVGFDAFYVPRAK